MIIELRFSKKWRLHFSQEEMGSYEHEKVFITDALQNVLFERPDFTGSDVHILASHHCERF